MKSNIMKGISYAVLILGVLGSIIIGVSFESCTLAIAGIIEILILFFIMFALSALMEEVEAIKESQKNLLTHVKRIERQDEKVEQNLTKSIVNASITDDNEKVESMQKTIEVWGKPNGISQEVYDAALAVLDDMDEYLDKSMPMELFQKNIKKAYEIIKKYCDSNTKTLSINNYFETALEYMTNTQDITVNEIEEYKEKFLKWLNFEE